MTNIRVVIADDHEVIRRGFAALVGGSDIEIVGSAGTGVAAVELAHQTQPNVVVLDVRMPEGDGFSTLQRLKRELPNISVLILTTYDHPTYICQAAALGASGYVLKGSSREVLLAAIRTVADGGNTWTEEDIRRARAAQPMAQPVADLETPLTRREIEVLCHMANGSGNKEIARLLEISVETVKEHVHNILGKLGASGRTQAAIWAVRHGLA